MPTAGSVETYLMQDSIGVYVRIGKFLGGPKLRNRDDVEFLKDGGTSLHIPPNWQIDVNRFVTKKNA